MTDDPAKPKPPCDATLSFMAKSYQSMSKTERSIHQTDVMMALVELQARRAGEQCLQMAMESAIKRWRVEWDFDMNESEVALHKGCAADLTRLLDDHRQRLAPWIR